MSTPTSPAPAAGARAARFSSSVSVDNTRRASSAAMLSPASCSAQQLVVAPSTASLVAKLARDLPALAARAIGARGVFTIGVSGGSMPKLLSGLAAAEGVEWDKWQIFLCDERCVPESDAESTVGALRKHLLSKIAIPQQNVHTIAQNTSPAETAQQYQSQLQAVFGADAAWPRFDALLLGCGPDGHTASLFPRHPLLQEKSAWCAAITDSPKPPPCRITLTLPVIAAARVVAFIATGEGKAPIVRSLFTVVDGKALLVVENAELPCTLAKPAAGQLVWYVDEEAAAACPMEVMELRTPVHGTLW